MKILAIKGHPTRGQEIIKILQMLGGKDNVMGGYCVNCIYYIEPGSSNILVKYINDYNSNKFVIFTLEQFLEKYPFKVGDMVQYKGSTSCRSIYRIEKMIWKNNQINYVVYNPWQEYDKCTITAEYLQPYKEEIKAEDRLEIYTDTSIDNDSKTDITIDGKKLVAPNGYTIKTATANGNSIIVEYVKNKPQYPETYEKCCEVIGINCHDVEIDIPQPYQQNMFHFFKLLICRDAYWKIAGEELGFGKPWKPDYDSGVNKYGIICMNGVVQKSNPTTNWERHLNKVLDFSIKEMRDVFFENFKDLIEKCKEFL